MAQHLVPLGPERRVGGDRDDRRRARTASLDERGQEVRIVLLMLEDVEQRDNIRPAVVG
jgi:hypothetical protein